MLAADSRSDAELHLTVLLAAQRRDELVALGRHGMAEALAFLAAEAAEALVERRQMRMAVEGALGTTEHLPVEAEPQDLERSRRLVQAVAEMQAGQSTPATTIVRCRAGHRTSMVAWQTSAGLLLVAEAPLPHPRTFRNARESVKAGAAGKQVMMLVHPDAGTVDVACLRCQHVCRLDLASLDRAVRSGDTLIFAN